MPKTSRVRKSASKASASMIMHLGPGLALDVREMWLTNLALVGNSGSGKTLTAREIAEGTYGYAAQALFDFGGEFWTLREKFDYLLVGPNGDMPADPVIAADLARFIREKGCRVIIDLSKLTEDKQQEFVHRFGEALLLLPEKLWNTPLLIFIDEVHITCPQEERPASRKTVGNLSTLGRKQRICTVVASQRLAGVEKKLLGSINNRMYGRFIEPTDLRAAGEVLGFGKKEWPILKKMQPGSFYCMGPAFEGLDDVKLLRTSGKTKSRHIDRSRDKTIVVPPSKKVSLLAKDMFAKQAAIAAKKKAEDNEIENLKRRIKELEGGTERKKLVARIDELLKENAATKVAAAKKAPPAKPTVVKALSKGQIAELRKSIAVEFSKIRAQYAIEIGVERKRAFTRASNIFRMFAQAADAQLLDDARRTQATDAADKKFMKSEIEKILARVEAWSPAHQPSSPSPKARSSGTPASTRSPTPKITRLSSGPGDSKVTGSVRKILIALAQHPEGLDRDQIAIYSGVSPRSSGLPASLTTLNSNGWTEKRDDKTFATQAGIDALGEYEDLPEGQALVDHWIGFFTGGTSRLLRTLVEAGPEGLERDEAARQSGISVTSSGLPASISELTKSKFITVQDRGKHLTASHVLLNAAAS